MRDVAQSKLCSVASCAALALDAIVRSIYIDVDLNALRRDVRRAAAAARSSSVTANATASANALSSCAVALPGTTRASRELAKHVESRLAAELQLRPVRLLLNSETWYELILVYR